MTQTAVSNREERIKEMFTRIAGRYDLMNRLMSGGCDLSWRRKMIRDLGLQPIDKLLDLGAGTGDLSHEVRKRYPGLDVTAVDLTLGMMLTGRDWDGVNRCNANALDLPFQQDTFDVVVSGFLVRNVVNVDQALAEQARVLKPSGRIAILDMTRPRKILLSPLIRFYLNRVVPFVGSLVTGQKDAYTYLPESTQNFLRAEELAEKMARAGFLNVGFETLNFGTVAIHWGRKPVINS